MNLTEQQPNEKQSIEIIMNMISATRENYRENGFYFLLWGWSVFIMAITQYVLVQLNVENNAIVWLALLPVGIFASIKGAKKSKTEKVKTHVDTFINALWVSIGISFGVIMFIQIRIGSEAILPMFMVFYGIGTFVTGRIIQFKPLVIGGICCWIFAIGSVYVSQEIQLLVISASLLVAYIIPGHLLNAEKNKNESN